ncbi:Adenylosuccinate lyase [Trichoderma citrinoviride]|uniref:Adenylosuccinate lyase n=1 Tax=Trichoderma citrinoviride TaxID=58853 RepID=A0A2T4B164_9HYPO|nr:Adenylosuccinate lyase [Trichoderma citrinoviride]PTB63059.1 Adenylosuccinate lyase [Trichoderma citrinoviride]
MADQITDPEAQILELQKQIEQLKLQGPQKSPYDVYQTSLTSRYCSAEMTELFSQRSRHSIWRRLWLGLAEAEHELGIDVITPQALAEMRAHLTVTDEDFEAARVEEKIRRHHVHAFGLVAPAAAGVIHYGATSCYVTDNAELIMMRDALDILIKKLSKVIANLRAFSLQWKAEPTLAYTHLQSAQAASQWLQDLTFDLENLENVRKNLKFRGAQGTTGTQASFLEIFGGDHAKCDQLNVLLCKKFGFPACYDISTQTYTRKVDLVVAQAVAGIGATAHKIGNDIRLLSNFKEVEEPIEARQIGSSAMAFKRNPMRSERICSLSRALMAKPASFANTLSTQWMERTLDDSAIRRMDIPEMFLLAEAVLIGLDNVTDGLVVYPARIRSRFLDELPFMVTEAVSVHFTDSDDSLLIIFRAHEEIRVLSREAASVVKLEGKPNDLIERIRNTEFFRPIWDELDSMMKPELYVGRSVEIVERYCGAGGPVEKALAPYAQYLAHSTTAQLNV